MIDQFSDVVKNITTGMLSEMYTVLPGIIEKYDPELKQVSVKPLLKKSLAGTELDLPVIENVPIIFPSTKKSLLAFPLSQGDGCLLLFSQRSLDDWLSKGGNVLPTDPRMFDLSDAIAIPGLFNFKESGRESTGEALEIYHDDGDVEIQGKEDNAVRYSSLKTAYDQLKSEIDKLITDINTLKAHTHPVSVSGTATAQTGATTGILPVIDPQVPSTGDITPSKVENVLLP
jgi:hypothetical protein